MKSALTIAALAALGLTANAAHGAAVYLGDSPTVPPSTSTAPTFHVFLNQPFTVYVWGQATGPANANSTNFVQGLSLDLNEDVVSGAADLSGNSSTIENPNNRWNATTNTGTLNVGEDLFDNFRGSNIYTTANRPPELLDLTGLKLFATLNLNAGNTAGTSDLFLELGQQRFSESPVFAQITIGPGADQTIGTPTTLPPADARTTLPEAVVNVIPEPATAGVLAGVACVVGLRRRRRA